MKSNWKPGDVARVNGSVAVRTDDNVSWWTTSGRLSDCNVAHVHPLVVIDPESAEQVERLTKALVEAMYAHGKHGHAANGMHPDDVTDALREFANPTPPVEEPTEDGWYAYDGGRQTMIFRLTRGQWHVILDSGTSDRCEWGYIEQALGWNLVKILSEGVTP